MIPAIRNTSPVQKHYLSFLEKLGQKGFSGDICPDYASRTVLSTDNSIYQVLPQGVVYPKNIQDLTSLTALSNEAEFQDIVLSPRGGGTGTNGQSLTDGLIVDTSKYMNQILEINVEQQWVRVQCGVVKDQLNAALKAHGLFFAPELSTSNRATIGGMINTDASGQGSCAYGKTRDHVLELTTVLCDGSLLLSSAVDEQALSQEKSGDSRAAKIHQLVDRLEQENRQAIKETFPPLNRCLTGYDLAHIRNSEGLFDLNSVLCGSEGTLGFIVEAKLNVLQIPKLSALVNLQYKDFDTALRDANTIMKAGPTSIETIDSRVLGLAKQDNIWTQVDKFFPYQEGVALEGLNLVEYTAETEEELQAKLKPLLKQLDFGIKNNNHSYTIAYNEDVAKIWGMRKKAVGLLGNSKGEARPMPFVEDTAVPPENLADFILEFRALLDSHKLKYGMFGHVDAGVLHVRPILDMKQKRDERLVRKISDQVVELTHKYGGLLWGEHGKGVRSEYAPKFFGSLYPVLQQIKSAFDPHNQLNPGKIATPVENIPLLKIDEVPTRGQQDKLIDPESWKNYDEGMFCNGNGACHNWDPNDAMCPSWKSTRKRTHTPKGRASLVREWLLQLSLQETSADQEKNKLYKLPFWLAPFRLPEKIWHSMEKKRGEYDFSHEVHESMMGCLACKSCTGSCPIKVDVPEFRSKFLELYYSRYLRPLKDYFVGTLEFVIPTAAKFPKLYNKMMSNQWMTNVLAKHAGLVDSPLISTISFDRGIKKLGIAYANDKIINGLSQEDKQRTVILVQDAFTRYFDPQLALDCLKSLQNLGFKPLVARYKANGKPLHVHGFRRHFAKTAQKNNAYLSILANTGIPLIGIEPSMTLAYRAEYKKALDETVVDVLLVQEWLAKQELTPQEDSKHYKFLAHCTEKTNAAPSIKDWQIIFNKLGHTLDIVDVGCCGMAGTFGHEQQNLETSKHIYTLSWQNAISDNSEEAEILATGYSCRSQVKRMDNKTLKHPLQAI